MNPRKYEGEQGGGELRTVPDQTMTIRQLMDSYARGIPANSNVKEPIFNEDIEMMSPQHYDLAEIDELKAMYKGAQQDAEQIRNRLTSEINRRSKEEKEAKDKEYGIFPKPEKSEKPEK